jgi:beta-glucosidase
MSEMKKYKDESLNFKERAEDLVSRMTIPECASQMIFRSEEVSEFGIKAYNWWNEALHGVARAGMATVFPQAIGLAATFDDELIYKIADVVSTEGRAKFNTAQKYEDYGIYKGITFWSPNVNIFRDPRWGRGQETYGEDTFLTSILGVAFVKGLQGNDARYLKSAACAKHFAVHSGPEDKRHEFNAVATIKDMTETYLPAFKALVDVNVEGFMGAYNRTNGEPCCGSKTLLKDILRDEWGFEGYVVSDCWAIVDFHLYHKVTTTQTESIALALKNGCDLNCGNIYENLLLALEEGLITEEQIRESTVSLMTTRMKLGMFDKNTPFDHISYDIVDCPEHRNLNYETARKSLVLLKNNGILPLDKEKIKNIAVIGPNANSIVALEGNYHGTANQYNTVLESIIRECGENIRVNYSKGCELLVDEKHQSMGNLISEVKNHVDLADVVVLVVGLDETIEGEDDPMRPMVGDKQNLLLPKCQQELLELVCSRGKKVIIVNMSGSAIDFDYGNENAAAIIQAWYPGAMGGVAISDLLFGKYSPSGKLPVTFYYNENKLPDFEDYDMNGRTYKFINEKALFPFGYGLTYSEFEYSNLTLLEENINTTENIKGNVTVKNTSSIKGDTILQIYIRDEEASCRVPHHKLCFTKRVTLNEGEEKEIEFTIDSEQMMVVLDDGSKIYEAGKFTIFAGGNQPDFRSEELTGEKCISSKFTLKI